MHHPDYDSKTVPAETNHKAVEVTFKGRNIAEITRALLLIKGYAPNELQIEGNTPEQVRDSSQQLTLKIEGMNATDFNIFFKQAKQFSHDFLDYAMREADVTVSLPRVSYNAQAKKGEMNILPTVQIDVAGNLKAPAKLVKILQDHQIDAQLIDNGRKIGFHQDVVAEYKAGQPHNALHDKLNKLIHSGKHHGHGR